MAKLGKNVEIEGKQHLELPDKVCLGGSHAMQRSARPLIALVNSGE